MLRTRCRNSIMYNDTLWNYDTVCAPLHLAFGASEFFSVLDFAILAWVLIATQRASERPLAVRLHRKHLVAWRMYGLVLNRCWSLAAHTEVCVSWPSIRFEILRVLQAPVCTSITFIGGLGISMMTTSWYCFVLTAGGLWSFLTDVPLEAPEFSIGVSN